MVDMSRTRASARGSKETLAEIIEHHVQKAMSWMFSSPYSRVEDEPEYVRLSSDIPHPFCNCVFRSRFPAKGIGARVDRIKRFFMSRGLPVSWWIGPSCRPSSLRQELVSRGFVLGDEAVGMSIDLRRLNEDLPIPEGLDIRRVENEDVMRQFLIPWGRGFELPEFVASGWGRMDSSHGYGPKQPRVNYVGMIAGKPVSCTTLFKTSDGAGIYSVATVPEMRRKGAATALIVNALRQARDEGYDTGLLQANPNALGVYRRIGFVEQPCKIDIFFWQPPSAASG